MPYYTADMFIVDKQGFVDRLKSLAAEGPFEQVHFAGVRHRSRGGSHAFARLAVTFDGNHEMRVEERGAIRTIAPARGEATFMPVHSWNQNTNARRRDVVTFMFYANKTQLNFVEHSGNPQDRSDLKIYVIDRPLNLVGRSIIDALTALGAQPNRRPQDQLLVKALLENLLWELDQAPEKRPSKSTRTWEKVSCLIEELFCESVTREQVADELGLSPNYLSNLCKSITGERFNQYVTNVRINNARYLLAHPSLTVADVGKQCGYPDASYFCQVFKKATGVTPAAYRLSMHA